MTTYYEMCNDCEACFPPTALVNGTIPPHKFLDAWCVAPAITTAPKRGFRFLHASWKKSQFSAEEMRALPATQTALEFVVTRVARGLVYYRPVYRHSGEVTNHGGAFVEGVDKFWNRVLCPADETGCAISIVREARD